MFRVHWKTESDKRIESSIIIESEVNQRAIMRLQSSDCTVDDIRFKSAFREVISKKYPTVKTKNVIIVKVEKI